MQLTVKLFLRLKWEVSAVHVPRKILLVGPVASQLSREGFVEFWEAKDSKTFQYKSSCGDCNIS